MVYQWYIIHTNAGAERKIKEDILIQATKRNMGSIFNNIVIPSIQVPGILRGKHVNVEKKLMPSYILIHMEMNDESWHLVSSIPKVTGFLGNNSPKSIPEDEVKKILNRLQEKAEEISSHTSFEIGETIEVVDGPFDSFVGTIEEIDNEKSKLKVSVTIFGRSTPVELNFNQVKKK